MGVWTQSTIHYTKCPYYKWEFLLSLNRQISVLTIRRSPTELHSAWENWKEIISGRRISLGPVPVKPDSWKPVLYTIDFWKTLFNSMHISKIQNYLQGWILFPESYVSNSLLSMLWALWVIIDFPLYWIRNQALAIALPHRPTCPFISAFPGYTLSP